MPSKRLTRAQAALEFLTIYGWAFLIILIMIGVLAYFGVLSPSKLLPNRCNFGPEFQCLSYQISATSNTLKLRLKNNLGAPINVQSLTVGSEGSVPFSCTSTPMDYTSQLWSSGSWSQSGLVVASLANVNNGVTAENAFHTDPSGPDSYLQLDLGAGNPKQFSRVDISIYRPSGTITVYAIWDIQYSDDGTSWTTVFSGAGGHPITGPAPVRTDSYTWGNVGAHRYWRLLKTDAAAGGDYHSEIQFYEGSATSLAAWKSSQTLDLTWSNCNSATAGIVAGEKGKILVTIRYYLVTSGSGYAKDVKGEIFSTVV